MEQTQEHNAYLGMILDGAVLEKKLGQGGMGAVYLARHLTLEKYIAIKILPPEFTRTDQAIERFLREARSAAKLEHPNVVQIYNAGNQNGVHFISMQFVPGDSLENQITKLKQIPLPQALWIIRSALQGISFAHQNQIIHRDIKPDNIMITSTGEVKVVDFGLARSSESGNTLSSPGQIMGTPYFMSPEQCNGETADQRSDIYSLGITFYYMLSGIRPYDGNSAISILMQHAGPGPVKELDAENIQIPITLRQVIKKMMEKDIEKRYQNMEDILGDVENICRQIPPIPLKVEVPFLPPPTHTLQNTHTPTLISGTSSAHTVAASLPTEGNFRPEIPTVAYDRPISNLKTMSLSDSQPKRSNTSSSLSVSNFSKTPPPKNPWGKLLLFLILLGIVLLFVGQTLQKQSKKRAYLTHKNWIEQQISNLKTESPVDFEEIQNLYHSLQKDYPESKLWCQEQLVVLEQEEKAYAKNFLEINEKELKKQDPVPFEQIRALYEPLEEEYPADIDWCKAQQERLFQEELTLLFAQQKYTPFAELLGIPIQQSYPSLYQKMFPQIKTVLEQTYHHVEKAKTLRDIQGKELEFLALYQNLFRLKETDLNRILFYQREVIELMFAQISEIGGNDFPLLIESFAFACQIPDEEILLILKSNWKKVEANFILFLQYNIQTENVEKINYILKYIKSFLPGNKTYQHFFEELERYLEQQTEGKRNEEKIRLQNSLAKTLFPITFPNAWKKLGGQEVAPPEDPPEKSPKDAAVEEFIKLVQEFREKYQQNIQQKRPFKVLGMQAELRNIQKRFFQIQQEEGISEELMNRLKEELAQLKTILPTKREQPSEQKKDRRIPKEPRKDRE